MGILLDAVVDLRRNDLTRHGVAHELLTVLVPSLASVVTGPEEECEKATDNQEDERAAIDVDLHRMTACLSLVCVCVVAARDQRSSVSIEAAECMHVRANRRYW